MVELTEIKEKSTCFVTVAFKDENGVAVIPTAAYYSLYCETTSYEILAETEIVGPGSSQEITITSTQNQIRESSSIYETKLLTIRWTYSGGTRQGTGEYRYKVKNLGRIT